MKVMRMTVCGAVLVGAFGSGVWGASSQGPFDPPLMTRRETFRGDPKTSEGQKTISCFDFANFTIKQVDLGEVGAESLSIVPAAAGQKSECREEPDANEYTIPGEVWSGYFGGVKGDYAFFDAGDGVNGGLGVMAFQISSRQKVFDDVAESGFQSIVERDGGLVLRYRRVFTGVCSVVTDGEACAERVARDAGVSSVPLEMCAEGYKAAKQEMAKARCEVPGGAQAGGDCIGKELKTLDEQKWDMAPTVVVYEVEAAVGKDAPVVKAAGEALACRPSD